MKEIQKNKDQEGEAAATGPQAETLEAKRSWTADSHSALETEGASSSAWGPGWNPHLRIPSPPPPPAKVVGGRLEPDGTLCGGAFPSIRG